MKITRDNFEDGAHLRGVAWEVFDTGMENEDHDLLELQKIDDVEHAAVDPALFKTSKPGVELRNPWFEDDLEVELWLLLLWISQGHSDACGALLEIGFTPRELQQLRRV